MNLRTLWNNARSRNDSEFEQSLVRVIYVALCSLLVYGGFFPVNAERISPFQRELSFGIAWLYWLLHFLHMALWPDTIKSRRAIGAVMDQVMVMIFLYLGGPTFAPMIFMSATISSGYGLRFGSNLAVLSAISGGIGIFIVALENRTWFEQSNWLASGILLASVVPLYTAYLGRRLEKQKAESEAEQRRLSYLATHDSLTGLVNRPLFTAQLERAMLSCARSNGSLAVLFIDLDRFKAVNDRLGHDVGDDLLRRIARKLNESIRSSDLAARIGGDEFLVLFDRLDPASDVPTMAARLENKLVEALTDEERSIGATASIGSALYTARDGAVPVDVLIKQADEAMYQAKNERRKNLFGIVPIGTNDREEPKNLGRNAA